MDRLVSLWEIQIRTNNSFCDLCFKVLRYFGIPFWRLKSAPNSWVCQIGGLGGRWWSLTNIGEQYTGLFYYDMMRIYHCYTFTMGKAFVNLFWRGWFVHSKQGSCQCFCDHVKNALFPSGQLLNRDHLTCSGHATCQCAKVYLCGTL